jgi:hypothetical protein
MQRPADPMQRPADPVRRPPDAVVILASDLTAEDVPPGE